MDAKRQPLPPEVDNLLFRVERDLGVPGEPGRFAGGLLGGGYFLILLGVFAINGTLHYVETGALAAHNAPGPVLVGVWLVYFGWRLFKSSSEVSNLEAQHRSISHEIRAIRAEEGR